MKHRYGTTISTGITSGVLFSFLVIGGTGILGILTGVLWLIRAHGIGGAIIEFLNHSFIVGSAGVAITIAGGGIAGHIINIPIISFIAFFIGMVIGAIGAFLAGLFILFITLGLTVLVAQNTAITITAPGFEGYTLSTAVFPLPGEAIVGLFILMLIFLIGAAVRTNTGEDPFSVTVVFGIAFAVGYAIVIGVIFAATLGSIAIADSLVPASIEVSMEPKLWQSYLQAGVVYPLIGSFGGIVLAYLSELVR